MSNTTLESLIKKKKWTEVIERVRVNPIEISVQTKITFKCGTAIQCFPIHLVCMRKPPLDIVLALLAADQEIVMKKDSLKKKMK